MYCQKWLKHPCAQQPLFFGFFLLSFLFLFHFTTFLLYDFIHLTPMLAFLLTGFGALICLSCTLGRYQSLGPIHSLSYWRNNFHCMFWTIRFSFFFHCSGNRISFCHDLKEILWVTNFLLYLSNMLTTVVVKELRFY